MEQVFCRACQKQIEIANHNSLSTFVGGCYVFSASIKSAGFMLSQNKQFYEKLSGEKLTEQELFEAKQNIVGFFDLLYRIDARLDKEKKKHNLADSSAGST